MGELDELIEVELSEEDEAAAILAAGQKFVKRLCELCYTRYIQFQPKPKGVPARKVVGKHVSQLIKQCINPTRYRKSAWEWYKTGTVPAPVDDESPIQVPEAMQLQAVILVYRWRLNSNGLRRAWITRRSSAS